MQTFTTPDGHNIDEFDIELMRSEILIHTMERVENATLFKIYDLFKSIEKAQ
ncbi:hypothetical protein UFOVP678_17 [uncultured Caudovirales phage]|uniref:Uncharacterized protein n=1 Tax=uncultured Caudovirales phage TaxID=2100421 RepID=A0A6J5NF42_9CAUD|nr:hypothetical protein UFOVP678_17 [uncultured Caudovirales phage]